MFANRGKPPRRGLVGGRPLEASAELVYVKGRMAAEIAALYPDPMLKTTDVSRILKVKVGTLAKWRARSKRKGSKVLPYFRISRKGIVYARGDVVDWMLARRVG